MKKLIGLLLALMLCMALAIPASAGNKKTVSSVNIQIEEIFAESDLVRASTTSEDCTVSYGVIYYVSDGVAYMRMPMDEDPEKEYWCAVSGSDEPTETEEVPAFDHAYAFFTIQLNDSANTCFDKSFTVTCDGRTLERVPDETVFSHNLEGLCVSDTMMFDIAPCLYFHYDLGDPALLLASTEESPIVQESGSVLSEGNVTVLVGIAGIALGFIGGVLLGRKKKAAAASEEE